MALVLALARDRTSGRTRARALVRKWCPTPQKIEKRERLEKLEYQLGAVVLALAMPLALIPEIRRKRSMHH